MLPYMFSLTHKADQKCVHELTCFNLFIFWHDYIFRITLLIKCASDKNTNSSTHDFIIWNGISIS